MPDDYRPEVESPVTPIHPHCRCRYIPVSQSAANLSEQGFDIFDGRASKFGQVSGQLDFEGWLNRMEARRPDFVKGWLGPTRYKLWKNHGFNLSDFVDGDDPSNILNLDQLPALESLEPSGVGVGTDEVEDLRNAPIRTALDEMPDRAGTPDNPGPMLQEMNTAFEKNKEFHKLDARIKALRQKMDNIGRQQRREIERLKEEFPDLDPLELQNKGRVPELEERWNELHNQKWNLMDQRDELREARWDKIRRVLETDNPADPDIDIDYTSAIKNQRRTDADEAYQFTKSIVDDDAVERWNDLDWHGCQKRRAFHEQIRGVTSEIHMPKRSQRSSYAHELGHWIGHSDKHIHDRAEEFLLHRWSGAEPTGLPGSGTQFGVELYLPDEWMDKYMGKWYGSPVDVGPGKSRATEIVSMGVEWLHKNPREFAQRDPEMFNFIVALLRGEI